MDLENKKINRLTGRKRRNRNENNNNSNTDKIYINPKTTKKNRKNIIIPVTLSDMKENPIDRFIDVFIKNGYDKTKSLSDYKFITAVDYYHDGIKGDRLTQKQKALNEELLDRYLWKNIDERLTEFKIRDVNISELERKTRTYFEKVLSIDLDASKKSGRFNNTLDIGKIFDKKGNLLIGLNDKIFNEKSITIEYNSNTNPRVIANPVIQKKFYQGLRSIFERLVGKGKDISSKDILINVDAKFDPIVFAMFESNDKAKQMITPANALDSGFVSIGFEDQNKFLYLKNNNVQVSNFLTSNDKLKFSIENDGFDKNNMVGYKWKLEKISGTVINTIKPTTKQINGPSIQTLSSYIQCSNKPIHNREKCIKSVDSSATSQISLKPFLEKINNSDLFNKVCFDVKHMGDFEQINYAYNYAIANKDKIIINLTGDINCATYSDTLQSFITILSTPNSIHISVGKDIEEMSELEKEQQILKNNFKELSATLEMNKILTNIGKTIDEKEEGDLYKIYKSIEQNITLFGKEEIDKDENEKRILMILLIV